MKSRRKIGSFTLSIVLESFLTELGSFRAQELAFETSCRLCLADTNIHLPLPSLNKTVQAITGYGPENELLHAGNLEEQVIG